jgi:predicted dehydrogenase
MAHKIVRFAVVGTGSRGNALAEYMRERPGEAVVTAAADPNPEALRLFAKSLGVNASNCFGDWHDLLDITDEFDAVIISTPDFSHAEPAIEFCRKKKHVLLEKPMAPTEKECRAIVAEAKKSDRVFAICHVLRYTPYTEAIRKVIDSGSLGTIQCVQHLEPVGFWHQAHSFVRGNWRSTKVGNFMLMAKSCHDLDWLQYIVGAECDRVSSFGSLGYFNRENKPQGSADRCLDCGVEADCPYSARHIYLDSYDRGEREWPLDVLARPVTREGLEKAVKSGPYGRCVFACDNDVVDHQVVNLLYRNGVTASFTMTAFTEKGDRRTTICGSRGELRCDGEHVELYDFLSGETKDVEIGAAEGGHAGGDFGLMKSFVSAVAAEDPSLVRSSPEASLESHLIAFAAEKARLEGTVERIVR